MNIGPMLRSLRRRKSAAALLVLEVALGMLVLVNTVVIGSHYWDETVASTGVNENNVLFVTRRFPPPRPAADEVREQGTADLRALAQLDALEAVAVVDEELFADSLQLPTVVRSDAPGGGSAVAWPLRASAGVVDALGLQVVRGRALAPGERGVALVTSTLAARIASPGGEVLGQRVEADGLPRLEIVGVLRDFHLRIFAAPDAQSVLIAAELPVASQQLNYVVRSRPGTGGLAPVVARIQQTLAPAQLTFSRPNAAAGRVHRIARGAFIVMGWMTVIVVGVALAGALAVTSFSVSERTRQIAVRRALGATRSDIVLYFLGENALMTTAGIALGLAVTLPLNRLMGQMNLMPFAGWRHVGFSTVLFWTASLLSALAPALRAARVPPTVAGRTL